MTKNYLLAAVAVTALIAAGSAQAGNLSGRAGTGAINATPTSPYKLARELNFPSGVAAAAGQFDLIYQFNAPLNPGSYTITVSYSGATITTPLPTTVVSAGAATAAGDRAASGAGQGPFGLYVSTRGGTENTTIAVTNQTSTQVTLSLFIPAGNTVDSIFLNPALLLTGNLQITAAANNQITAAVVDAAVISTLITTNNQGFAANVDRTITAADGTATAVPGAGAGLDTRIEEGTAGAPFNTLIGTTAAGGPYQIGQVNVAVAGTAKFDEILGLTTASTPVFRDLNGTAVALTDVTNATISTRGLFGNLTVTAADSAAGAIATGAITTTAESNVIVAPGGAPVSTTTVSIAPTGTPQIAPTDFDVSVQLALGTGFTSPAATPGSFESLQTDGFTYIIPWVASQTQSGISGNQSVIRISNIRSDGSTAGGRVYAQVYNPTVNPQVANTAGQVGTTGTAVPAASLSAGRSVLVGTLGSTGELILSSQALETALGNFGRADIRLTITTVDTTGTSNTNVIPVGGAGAGASTIVVKRLIATANGGLTEVEVLAGSATSVTNLPVNQGVPY
jgi:hypothetical protein